MIRIQTNRNLVSGILYSRFGVQFNIAAPYHPAQEVDPEQDLLAILSRDLKVLSCGEPARTGVQEVSP